MHSRPVCPRQIITALLLAIAAVACAFPAFAQTAQNRIPMTPGATAPIVSMPDVRAQSQMILPPGLTPEETETFKKNFADYLECRRLKADEIRLTETASHIITFRDRRVFWEAEIAKNSSLQANIGSYDQGLATMFALYQSLGGTASTIDAVVPLKAPCTNPWETFKRPKIPLTDHRSRTIPAQ